jgi:hypothetical protein
VWPTTSRHAARGGGGVIVASIASHLDKSGVKVVGKVSSGLPPLGLPDVSWGDLPLVLSVSVSTSRDEPSSGALRLVPFNRTRATNSERRLDCGLSHSAKQS